MGFFEIPDDSWPDEEEPEPRRHRWRGDDLDTVGVSVPITALLARTEEVAVSVSGLFAFPAGFRLSLITLLRMDPPKEELRGTIGLGPWRRGRIQWGKALHFGIGFSDGSKVTDRQVPGPHHREHPSSRSLEGRGGGGGGRKWTQGLWCEPLPPPGPMRFVCEWKGAGIEETETVVDADLILEAASRATALWPDDIDLPPDDESGGEGRHFYARPGIAFTPLQARTTHVKGGGKRGPKPSRGG